MTTPPVQRSDAAPAETEDALSAAETIANDPSKQGSAEWLAAMQLIADRGGEERRKPAFADLEREMQALRGMSEI